MNEKITDVLNILDKEDNPSQREIAKKTGFSLGLVNTLIKKCAKIGLVKIERLNSRNIKYILTPEGIKKITKKTVNYVKKSYQAIQQIQYKVKELAQTHIQEEKKIYILKERQDEVFNLVKSILDDLNIDYEIIEGRERVVEIIKQNHSNKIVVYHWDPGLELDYEDIESINIFRN